MTAEEWDQLRSLDSAYDVLEPHRYDRKLRLFVAACFRSGAHNVPDEQYRRLIDLSELFADEPSRYQELAEAVSLLAPTAGWNTPGRVVVDVMAIPSASYADSARRYRQGVNQLIDVCTESRGAVDSSIFAIQQRWKEQFKFLSLLRDIVGNPFRPVVFAPAWRSDTAVAIATGIYADRAFDRMPILADALEDAGCDSADVLVHCRDQQQVHARGCWVVDLVLGKS